MIRKDIACFHWNENSRLSAGKRQRSVKRYRSRKKLKRLSKVIFVYKNTPKVTFHHMSSLTLITLTYMPFSFAPICMPLKPANFFLSKFSHMPFTAVGCDSRYQGYFWSGEENVLIFDIVDGSILRWSRGGKQIENKYCPLVAWKDLKRRSTNGYC